MSKLFVKNWTFTLHFTISIFILNNSKLLKSQITKNNLFFDFHFYESQDNLTNIVGLSHMRNVNVQERCWTLKSSLANVHFHSLSFKNYSKSTYMCLKLNENEKISNVKYTQNSRLIIIQFRSRVRWFWIIFEW